MDLGDASLVFQQFKVGLETFSGLSRDALHIHIGLTVFIAVRLLWRRRGGWAVAWLVALGFALGGEWLDLEGETLSNALQPLAAHWHDIWNTMVWPTILALIGRWLEPRRAPPELAPSELTPTGQSGDQSA